MSHWATRPPEANHLFNPAFCGEILHRFASRFFSESGDLPSYPLCFLVLPVVLHKPTRDLISLSTRTPMHFWLQSNQHLRVGFPERARDLLPITRESLMFLLQTKAIELNEVAEVKPRKKRRSALHNQQVGEVYEIYKKAELLGKWFSRAGTPSTIFTMWGVRP